MMRTSDEEGRLIIANRSVYPRYFISFDSKKILVPSQGRLSDDERMELYMTARKGAEPDYDYKGEIDALWAAIRELQKTVAPPEPDKEWPEFVQPTHAGTAYQVGDKVTFRGERYVCILAHCVWSPADYPAAWQKQSATT